MDRAAVFDSTAHVNTGDNMDRRLPDLRAVVGFSVVFWVVVGLILKG
jgi:hypothetical protein